MTRALRFSWQFVLAALAAAVLPSCVLTPSWGEGETSRRDPLDLSGMASKPNASLQVQLWNHNSQRFDIVRSFSATSTPVTTSPELYPWSVTGLAAADLYWSGGGCALSGQLTLRVLEANGTSAPTELATFDEDGQRCLNEHMVAGEHPVAAGQACKRDDARVILHAPPECILANPLDLSPPTALVRLDDGRDAWQLSHDEPATTVSLSRNGSVRIMALGRDSQSAMRSTQLTASIFLECRAADGSLQRIPQGSTTQSQGLPFDPTRYTAIGLVAQRTFTPAAMIASCPQGTTFNKITGELFAEGTNGVGLRRAAPRLSFTIL